MISTFFSAMSGVNSRRDGTHNVRDIGLKKNQIQLRRLITEESMDILAVQETKLPCYENVPNSLEVFLPCYEVSLSRRRPFRGWFLFVKSLCHQQNWVSLRTKRVDLC